MEVAVLAMLRKPLAKEFGIDGYGLALVASAIYAGMIAGSFFGGYLSDGKISIFNYNIQRSIFNNIQLLLTLG